MRARALASLAALSLALAACGDDESTTTTEPLTEATTTTEPRTDPTTTTEPTQTTTTEQPQTTTTEQEVTPPSGGIGGGGSGGSGGDSGGLSPKEKFEQFCDENPKACG